MIEWLQANWLTILGTIILLVAGFYVPGVRGLWMTGLKTLLSEKVLTKLFLTVAEKIVKSTKNTLDDVWLEELKKKIIKSG
jgi:hypothetical protein